jgi:Tfp pilus assembly protein PilV
MVTFRKEIVFNASNRLKKPGEAGLSIPELIISVVIASVIALALMTIFVNSSRVSEATSVTGLNTSNGQIFISDIDNTLRNSQVAVVKTTPIAETLQATTFDVKNNKWVCTTYAFGVTTSDGKYVKAVLKKTTDAKTTIPTTTGTNTLSGWSGWSKLSENIAWAPGETSYMPLETRTSAADPVVVKFSLDNLRVNDTAFSSSFPLNGVNITVVGPPVCS